MILEILKYPDKRLYEIAEPVNFPVYDDSKFKVDWEKIIFKLIDDMHETLEKKGGLGLAATQVGAKHRIIVVHHLDEKLEFINPEITFKDGVQKFEEGCLSVPDVFFERTRANEIKVKYFDRNGKEHIETFVGERAVILQHEIDHLDGKLFVDELSPLKIKRLRQKGEKLKHRARKFARR